MLGDEASESELRERLTEIVRATPPLMQVLSVARHLRLPDWLVFSGAVYQPVLNHLTGRPLDYGIKDYDLGYFDAVRSLLRGRGCGNSPGEGRFRRAAAEHGRGSQPSARASLV